MSLYCSPLICTKRRNIKFMKTKLILKKLIKKHYPYLERQQGKLGFGAPVEDWLQLKEFEE
jgi:hypothetical protein